MAGSTVRLSQKLQVMEPDQVRPELGWTAAMHEGTGIRIIGILAFIIGCIGATISTNAAAVTGRHAAFVVDANTGEILHADRATELRYPASLTKMMTLYIIFEHIEDQRISYQTTITASANAASRPPSKIGLKPGEKITIRQVVHALVTKSANDVATAVAEHIAGSEARFARLMTQKARQLGMRQTVFRNASGLPDPAQVTTARDIAQLALRLRDHFPNHYHQFRTPVFRYKGRRYRNHYSLLRRFPGVDGIKTGYTRASGFNLASSVRRHNRNVVAVVLGGKTARARNATMRRLLAKYVPTASATRTRQPATRVALRRAPRRAQRSATIRSLRGPVRRRPVAHQRPPAKRLAQRDVANRYRGAPRRVRPGPGARPTIQIARVRRVNVLGQRSARSSSQSSQRHTPDWSARTTRPSLRGQTGLQPGTLQGQAAGLKATNVDRRSYAPVRAATYAARRNTLGSRQTFDAIQIQVGAFRTSIEAHRQLQHVSAKAGGLLAGARPLAVRAISGNREIYRARYAGLSSNTATSTCNQMRRLGIECFVARAR